MQSSLRIRKMRKLKLAAELREEQKIKESSQLQANPIGDSQFEEIDLRLIDPAIHISERLKILEKQLESSKNLKKKPDILLIVLQYLHCYVVGQNCHSIGAQLLLQNQTWSYMVAQGVLSAKQVQQLSALKIMYRMAYFNLNTFLNVYGLGVIDSLLRLYGSTKALINEYVLQILNYLSYDQKVFLAVFSDFNFRAEIVRSLELGVQGKCSRINFALYSCLNLLREIKYQDIPDQNKLKSEEEFKYYLDTEQTNVAVLLVQYLKMPDIKQRSHIDALRGIIQYVSIDSDRCSFLAEVGILEPLQHMIDLKNLRVTAQVLKFFKQFSMLEDKILEARLLDTDFVERIAALLIECNYDYIKLKAVIILSNLVASSNLFIQKFIDENIFHSLGECLNSLSDNNELNYSIIQALGNGGFSATQKQMQSLLQQNIVDALIMKAQELSIYEHESTRVTLKYVLHALQMYLKRADQKYQEEKMTEKCDLFSDLSSPRWGSEVSNIAFRILTTYCGFEENQELAQSDIKIEF